VPTVTGSTEEPPHRRVMTRGTGTIIMAVARHRPGSTRNGIAITIMNARGMASDTTSAARRRDLVMMSVARRRHVTKSVHPTTTTDEHSAARVAQRSAPLRVEVRGMLPLLRGQQNAAAVTGAGAIPDFPLVSFGQPALCHSSERA
jgi:hypothetical protein